VRGGGGARLAFPEDEGPAAAEFRGGSTATWTLPAAGPGGSPRVRELSAATVTLSGMRALGGTTRLEQANAVGSALLREGDRTARANRLEVRPDADGGTRAVLEGDVLVSWPGAGRLDAIAAGGPGAAPPEGEPGTLLLASPGKVVLDLPPEGSTDRGGRFEVSGGAVLRRVVGEREIYRLAAAALDGNGAPGGRALEHLRATGDVALAGREEGHGGRRYELRGETLEVRGAAGDDGPRTADLAGPAGGPAEARFVGVDGHPLSVAARTLNLDRGTGALRAEGAVRGKGILPGAGGKAGAVRPGGGATEIACAVLDAVLAGGPAAGEEGSTRVKSLDARGSVWIRTETEYASGDRLRYEEGKGAATLHGDPARVTARSAAATGPSGERLEYLCEAPEIRIAFEDGRLLEALAPGGGRLVRHRVLAGAAPERVEATCRGPLSYRPAETRLRGDVAVSHGVLQGGAFVNLERTEGADEVVLHHPPAAAGVAGGTVRAVATADGGGMTVDLGAGDGARVEGVSRADFDGATGRVSLESSPGHPRFRVRSKGTTTTCRRAVYEFRTGVLVEMVGATVEGGR
jgi:hypothetical protein